MEKGWLKLHRTLKEKPIWLKSTPEQKSVLITLLLMANHEENEWEWSGEKFNVSRGQFVTSLDSIKREAGQGISIQNVRSSLNRFKKLEFLTYKSTKSGRIITICNWEDYQQSETATQQSTQQRPNKDPTTNKNDKNERKELFDRFWNFYDKKTGKMKSQKLWEKLTKTEMEAVMNHIPHYRKATPDKQYRKNPETYLRNRAWEDEVIRSKEDKAELPPLKKMTR